MWHVNVRCYLKNNEQRMKAQGNNKKKVIHLSGLCKNCIFKCEMIEIYPYSHSNNKTKIKLSHCQKT